MYSIFNPLDHPIIFATPRRVTPISAWHEHIPFGLLLIDLLRPNVFVELGTHYGDSYFSFCQAVQELNLGTRCYAVDNWEGDSHSGFYGPEVFEAVRTHHDPLYGVFSSLIKTTFDDASNYFSAGSIDLLHIDGYHTYEVVKHDFELWLPKMSARGIVLFHDTNVRERNFGVWRFWEDIKQKYPNFEFVHGHGLGVLGVGEGLPETMRTLFALTFDETLQIRNLFFQLGQKIALKVEHSAKLNSERERSAQERAQIRAALRAEQEKQERHLSEVTSERDRLVQEITQLEAALRAEQEKQERHLSEVTSERDRLVQEITQLEAALRAEREATAAKSEQLAHIGADRERLAAETTKLQATLVNQQNFLEKQEQHLSEVMRERDRLSQVTGERDRLVQEMAQLEAALRTEQCLREDSIRIRDQEIHELADSESYRFGLFCTWPIRKIWKGVRYFTHFQSLSVETSSLNTRSVGPVAGSVTSIDPAASAGLSKAITTQASLDFAGLARITEKEVARSIETDYSVSIPFEYRPLMCVPAPSLAVICHIFYDNLAAEFRRYLRNIPFQFDLFISTDTPSKRAALHGHFSDWSAGSVDVRLVINRGRDIAPKLISFRDVYSRYEYVLHLHSKDSSRHASSLTHWRGFLLENLVGSHDIVNSIFDAFARYRDLGVVASQHFEPVRHVINWGGNFEVANSLAKRMGMTLSGDQVLDFPSGSMFWARSAALQPLLDLDLSFEDFPDEFGRIDGTLAHAIERLYYFVCERAGFKWIKISHPELFGHTPAIVAISSPQALDRFIAEKTLMLTGGTVPAPRKEPVQGVLHSPRLVNRLQASALGCDLSVDPSKRVTVGIVTYRNSASQIRRIVESTLQALERAGLKRNGRILIVDNGVSVNGVSNEGLAITDEAVDHVSSMGNVGFAAAHNRLMETAFSFGTDIYIAANPDGAFHPDAIRALLQMMQAHDHRALIEAIQFPVEHPKAYDPFTFETPWASGACLAIPHDIFKEIGGFDDVFFMYCEDVDLSWRARAAGFAVRICPRAMFLHAVTNRPTDPEAVRMMFNSGIILAEKWGGGIAFEKWLKKELHALGYPPPDIRPNPVPKEWRRFADFSHQFSFAETRW